MASLQEERNTLSEEIRMSTPIVEATDALEAAINHLNTLHSEFRLHSPSPASQASPEGSGTNFVRVPLVSGRSARPDIKVSHVSPPPPVIATAQVGSIAAATTTPQR